MPANLNTLAGTWLFRAVIGITCYIVIEIRNDLKKLNEAAPVMQEQIRLLQNDVQKLNTKVFTITRLPAKKEDEILLKNILKNLI